MERVVLAVALLALAFVGGVVWIGCSTGGPTAPDPVSRQEPSAPVAAPAPAPTAIPSVVAPPTTTHDARAKGGFYSITNETGIPQFYCAAAFGVLPGGEQGAGTNLYEDQGVRQSGDVFSGQAPKEAACQYQQIQVDLTQSKDCRKFDWTNVLAAEVYTNPGFIAGSAFDLLEDEITYTPWSGPAVDGLTESTEQGCGTRKKITWEVKKYRCSGEIVKTIKSEVEEKIDCCLPQRASITGPTFPTYYPGSPRVPATYFWYWDMDNGEGNGPKQNACEGRGGVWLGDDYNIPNDGSNNEYDDVCRVTTGPSFPGGPGADVDFIKSVKLTGEIPAVQPSGGNPIAGGATLYGAGDWEVRLLAASSAGEYNANDPDYVKDADEAEGSCTSEISKSVSYNWVGHGSEVWWIEVRLNGAFHSKSAYVTNPSN